MWADQLAVLNRDHPRAKKRTFAWVARRRYLAEPSHLKSG
jgi:hypothetical protein